eukprot:scaffold32262_cov75-Phaeocystis_antarctica.AAC.4
MKERPRMILVDHVVSTVWSSSLLAYPAASAERNVVRVDKTRVKTCKLDCLPLSCSWSTSARWRSQLIMWVRIQMSFSRS